MPAGLYIHIPFCIRKCPYCDFYSVPMDEETADAYVHAVCDVISSGRFSPGTVDTVYFGGGTPSLFGAARLSVILEHTARHYGIADGSEITLEANPAAAGKALFAGLHSAGFNRISVGAQSGVDTELTALGRPHNAGDIKDTVHAAYHGGFDNISCDIMLGIPGQTPHSLSHSVDFLCAMPVTHISAYLLKIEEGTAFFGRELDLPDEDDTAELYLQCVSLLENQGYAQYEISNFSLPAKRSRHNLKYWTLEPYLGIGPSAHSFLDRRRFSFGRDLYRFIKGPFSTLCNDGGGGDFSEYAMLRLRLSDGLDLDEAAALYLTGKNLILSRAAPFIKQKKAVLDGAVLSLTPEGFLISNTIISSLIF